jgi:predicted porin
MARPVTSDGSREVLGTHMGDTQMVSRITLAVAASMLLGAAMTPVQAADLKGGGCCADIEERVAELEATVVRKGNRVVSLQIYGDITQGLLIWDNGDESDVYVTDNDALGSVLGFKGEATLKPGVKAGYKMELQVQSASSSAVTEGPNGDDPDDILSIRHNHLYIESERWGRITIGQQSSASDGAAQVNLSNSLIAPSPDQGTAMTPGGLGAGRILGEYASDFDGGRNDLVRYDSPTIYGFVASAAWGDDDYWDIALRFTKEFNSVKLAAAIAYAEDDTDESVFGNFTQVIGSASIMHVPTGLFATVSAGERDYDTDVTGSFWYTQGGIEKKWLPYGTTTLYAEYGNFDDIVVEGTNAELVGVGIVQKIDSAAMDFYAQARFWTIDDDANPDADELTTIMLGSRIQF